MKKLLVLALVLVGCGPLTPVNDAGAGGGGGFPILGGGGGTTGGGGGTTGGGGGTTGGGGGVTGGGGGALGGGGGSTGGGGGGAMGGGGGSMDAGTTWQFSIMTLSPAPANSGNIVGFGETDAGVWAVSSSGRVYRSTGGPFTEQLQLTSGVQPLDFEVASDGHMFIATTVRFYECATNCGTATSWTEHQLNASAFSLSTLCLIDSGHVLAVGGQGSGNDGIAFRWNGTGITGGPTTIGVDNPRGCWRGNGGQVYIPGLDGVVAYDITGQSFTPETSMTANGWRGGGSVPGKDFMCGSSNRIAERGAGQWADVFTPGSGANSGAINVIIGLSETEAFAFGGGFSSVGQAAFVYDGSTWRALNPDVPAVLAVGTSAFLSSDGSIFVGGYDNTSNQYPVILRGRRR